MSTLKVLIALVNVAELTGKTQGRVEVEKIRKWIKLGARLTLKASY